MNLLREYQMLTHKSGNASAHIHILWCFLLEMTAIDELKRQRVSSDLTTEEAQPPNRDLEAPGVIPPFLFGGVPSMQDNLRYAEAFAR